MTESLGFVLCAAVAAGAIVGCAHGNIKAPTSLTFHRLVGITAEDIERSPGTPVEQLLAARVPGLFLTRARDGHVVVHVRGPSTLADQEPLYIVNGIALGDAGNLSAIQRSEIATIEVLRDPTSTAMYGMRGSNGVIVVRTKGS